VIVTVHYEIYVGHPVLVKWIEVSSTAAAPTSRMNTDAHTHSHRDSHAHGDHVHDAHDHDHDSSHSTQTDNHQHHDGSSAASGTRRHGGPTPDECKGTNGCGSCPGTVELAPCDLTDVKQHWTWVALNGSIVSQGMCLSALGADLKGASRAHPFTPT
jgi:ferredoxin